MRITFNGSTVQRFNGSTAVTLCYGSKQTAVFWEVSTMVNTLDGFEICSWTDGGFVMYDIRKQRYLSCFLKPHGQYECFYIG
jgi:hypothetical protein